LGFEKKGLNVRSAYAPEVSCEERNNGFGEKRKRKLQEIPGNGDAVIGGDIKVHVSNESMRALSI